MTHTAEHKLQQAAPNKQKQSTDKKGYLKKGELSMADVERNSSRNAQKWKSQVVNKLTFVNDVIPSDDHLYHGLVDYEADLDVISHMNFSLPFNLSSFDFSDRENILDVNNLCAFFSRYPIDKLNEEYRLGYAKALYYNDQPCKAKELFDSLAASTKKQSLKDECIRWSLNCVKSAGRFRPEFDFQNRLMRITGSAMDGIDSAYSLIEQSFSSENSARSVDLILSKLDIQLSRAYSHVVRNCRVYSQYSEESGIEIFFDAEDDALRLQLLRLVLLCQIDPAIQYNLPCSFHFLNDPLAGCSFTINGQTVSTSDFLCLIERICLIPEVNQEYLIISFFKKDRNLLKDADPVFMDWLCDRIARANLGECFRTEGCSCIKFRGCIDDFEPTGKEELKTMSQFASELNHKYINRDVPSLSSLTERVPNPYFQQDMTPDFEVALQDECSLFHLVHRTSIRGSSIIYNGAKDLYPKVFDRFNFVRQAGATYARLELPIQSILNKLPNPELASDYKKMLKAFDSKNVQMFPELYDKCIASYKHIMADIIDKLEQAYASHNKFTFFFVTEGFLTHKHLYIDFVSAYPSYDLTPMKSYMAHKLHVPWGATRIINFDCFSQDNLEPADYLEVQPFLELLNAAQA